MKYEIISDDAKLRAFARYSSKYSGNRVTIDYLKQCKKVIGFTKDLKSGDNKYVAGYAINTKRPYRYLDMYNHDVITAILNQSGIKSELDICEITAIWHANDLYEKEKDIEFFELTEWEKTKFYFYSLRDAFFQWKLVVIGGSVVPSVWKRFKRVLNRPLYLGEIQLPEDKKDETGAIKTRNELALVVFQWTALIPFYLIVAVIMEQIKPFMLKYFRK